MFLYGISKVSGGEGSKPADLMASEQATDCFGGYFNGVWDYQGDTLDGKRYYAHDDGSHGVYYLHFDRDVHNGKNPSVCVTTGNNWIIDDSEPSLTALQDLDGDQDCMVAGYTLHPDTSGAHTLPTRAEWGVECGDGWRAMRLSFHPICDTSPPDYTYIYPEEWTAINVGCGTGLARQRTEVESCAARGGCDCSNERAPKSEDENQTACTTQWEASPKKNINLLTQNVLSRGH